MPRLLPLLLLAACSSGGGDPETTIAAYEETLAALDTLVADHVAAVDAATTREEVDALETAYLADWQDLHAHMDEDMDMLSDCAMDDEDMGMMDEAGMSMDAMDAAVSDHMADHEAHADVAACQASEDGHATAMAEHMDAMMAHGDHWRDSSSCEMGGMSM